jgi:hypothetical protein
MIRTFALCWMVGVTLWGCSSPGYLSVLPVEPISLDRRLAPTRPERAIERDQHLGGLRADLRFWEEALLRAEQKRIDACRDPEAAQVNTLAYARCQVLDQIYEQRRNQVAQLRVHYLRAVSGSGGSGR